MEDGEAYLRALGVTGDLRVRHHGEKARLEVAPDQMELVRDQWDAVEASSCGLGFAAVELDPARLPAGAGCSRWRAGLPD